MNSCPRSYSLMFALVLASGVPAGTAAASEFVIVASGDDFSFTRDSEFTLENNSYSTSTPIEGSAAGRRSYTYYSSYELQYTSEITVQFAGKTYKLIKADKTRQFDSRAEAEKGAEGLSNQLTRGDMLALALMKKDVSVADDTAEVIKDKPYHLVDAGPFSNAAPAKLSFRYALVIEVEGDTVLSYKFIRQGTEDAAN